MRAAKLFVPPPRHMLRLLVLIAGSILLVGLIAMGLLIGALAVIVAILAAAIQRWLSGHGQRRAEPKIIEGEFTVVPPHQRASLPRPE